MEDALGQAQMPASHGTLDNLKFLGTTFSQRDFVYNPNATDATTKLVVTDKGPWRHDSNGNPHNMLEVVQSLLPDLNVVFVIERDLNRNTVLYCVNESAPGVVDKNNPMTVMWLMINGDAPTVTGDGEEVDLGDVYTEDLTTLERTLAYGVVDTHVLADTEFTVRIRAVNGQDITIRYNLTDHLWEALISVQNKYLYLDRFRIFTEARKYAPWPKSVELHVDARLMGGGAVTYHFAI